MTQPNNTVLLAEDDKHDFFLIQRAFKKAGIPHPIIGVADGEQAMSYLMGDGAYSNRSEHPLPRLLLTDIKVPRVTGFDLLNWLKNQTELKEIPAIVLSNSGLETDRARALQLGARAYYVKPASLEGWVSFANELRQHWLV